MHKQHYKKHLEHLTFHMNNSAYKLVAHIMGFQWSFALPIVFLLLYSLFLFTDTNCLVFLPPTKCHEHESRALLQFKDRFVINKSASYNPFSYPKIASWNATSDCCSWDGIECDVQTGHVIAIDLSSSQIYGTLDANSSLFHIKHLQSLNLADNHFNYSQIPSRIGELSQLRHLNFSEANFFGEIPQQVSHLSKLQSFDLSVAHSPDAINLLSLKTFTLRSIIQNSTNLEILLLDFVSISSFIPDVFTNLTSLHQLSLYHCELYGEFPTGIFYLPKLRYLVVGYNPHLTGQFPDFHSSTQIQTLNLKGTSFYGTLPASFGNLKSLNSLSISKCNFLGSIPSSFGNLTQLTRLDIGHNKFKGSLSSFLLNLTKLHHLDVGFNEFIADGDTISWICKLSGINVLRLDSVSIGNEIPFCFTNFTQLNVLSLGWGNLTGKIPSWMMNLTNLAVVSLHGNHLEGAIPNSFFKHENLETFNVAANLLEGELELNDFLMLKKLTIVGLSYNKFSLISGKNLSNGSRSRIQIFGLRACNLTEFPNVLQHLRRLSYLYISHNNVSSFPNWIWGKTSLESLIISHNSLRGEISSLICNLKSLMYLDLSFNNLTGMIPSCLGNFSQSLQFLVLKGNKLIGPIPQRYMITSALRMIDLGKNNLQGPLPRALVNCKSLEFIDVSENQINDSFPCWLGTLPQLKVVVLRDNCFYGSIKCPTACTFSKLHIIDLSRNQFSESLPSKIIHNWKSMKASNMSQLQYEDYPCYLNLGNSDRRANDGTDYSFTMFIEGMARVYDKLQKLCDLIVVDLSSNKFCGEIPDVMGDLTGLVFLNLSNNMFSGSIPSSLQKLSNLQSLDLSLNRLSGKIPQQLEELTFLSYINVSYNNLSGVIPQNKQFLTFDASSFEGNQGLCGKQILRKCDAGSPFAPPSSFDDDQGLGFFVDFDWKVVLIGFGGGLLAGVALGSSFSDEIFAWLKRVISIVL